MPRPKKLRPEVEGAHYLVMGNLFIEGISAYQSNASQFGYDLFAGIPDVEKTVHIQVKVVGVPGPRVSF